MKTGSGKGVFGRAALRPCCLSLALADPAPPPPGVKVGLRPLLTPGPRRRLTGRLLRAERRSSPRP